MCFYQCFRRKRRHRAQVTQTAEIPCPFYNPPSARERNKQNQARRGGNDGIGFFCYCCLVGWFGVFFFSRKRCLNNSESICKISVGLKEQEKYVENGMGCKLAGARWDRCGNAVVTSEQILCTTLQGWVENRELGRNRGCARLSNNHKNCTPGNCHAGNGSFWLKYNNWISMKGKELGGCLKLEPDHWGWASRKPSWK